ncbi:MAG: two-component system, OmpR family, response regulator [Solirubrobacteraceae bacterium]|nr:two-component system, OmpR family, response regulator [Solirubrobacteraceae bacterium]
MTDTLLLVEDDRALRTFLADNLTADGFEMLVAGTARDAHLLLEARAPALAIVDVELPDASGLALITRVRKADPRFARIDPAQRFLVLSGRGSELDRVRGLQHGADDYVVKPFSYPELLLRVGAQLRRGAGHGRPGAARVRVGALEVDPPTRDVRVGGRAVDLSAKEFSLLRTLAGDPTRVFTKDELLREVWGFASMGSTRTLDSHACRLRRKLGVTGDRFVVNVWGVGYRLVEVAE